MIENSKAFLEVKAHVQAVVKEQLRETHARDMQLQKARLQRQIDQRLQKLPEYRRQYADAALNRILKRFYGESEERIATIADVALDAMEHDAYWVVLEQINSASDGDVGVFAASLEQFGLLELSAIGAQATHRRAFLDQLDRLFQNAETLEKDAHKSLESNLWVLGRRYSLMASNATLRGVVKLYCDSDFQGERALKRPDLLLSQDYGDAYLLIEFKRPSHFISRDDIAQAEKYRDDLSARLSATAKMDILMLGKGRAPTLDAKNLLPNIGIQSYNSVVSAARNELDWLLSSLSS